MTRTLTLLFLLFNLMISCKKDSGEPHLEFKNIKIITGFFDILGNPGDSLELFLDYTDGDANFGMPLPTDTVLYNCTVTFYKKSNGKFNLIGDGFNKNPKYFTITEIKEPNKTYNMGPVTVKTRSVYDGEIQINTLFVGYSNPYNIGDTLKITVQITDNDDNKSNMASMEKVYSY